MGAYHQKKYDVFISFRGADVRDGFLSHLKEHMRRNNITFFVDDQDIETGKLIGPALWEVIEKSRVSVVIFSEKYANSKWCLEELEKIFKCREEMGQIVLPVFYKVDSSHVQDLTTGSFKEALDEHRKDLDCLHKVQIWSHTLKTISSITGWDSKNFRQESKLVEVIVDDISKKLDSAVYRLVGIDFHVKKVESLLCIESPDFRTVGIWGMGGIGKTTIAEVIFRRMAPKFDSHIAALNVSQRLETQSIVSFQNEIIWEVADVTMPEFREPAVLNIEILRRVMRKKVLLVLDDVHGMNHWEAIEIFIGDSMFYPGSRIIITSRDKKVLETACNDIYQVKGLNDDEALELFSLNAFRQNHPPDRFMKLSRKILKFAGGLPLALRVLGSSLYAKDKEVWEQTLAELELDGNMGIMEVLQMSFNVLTCEERDIFLDVACFFRGKSWDRVQNILAGRGFTPLVGMKTLIDKSLITISSENIIGIHDLIQQMGWEIANTEYKGTRIWDHQQFSHVLRKDGGSGRIEGISVNMSPIPDHSKVSPIALGRMHNLRILKLYNPFSSRIIISLPQGLDSLSPELRYLHWQQYPLKSLPSLFIPKNLVELEMPSSKLESLWIGVEDLASLVRLDLSYSVDLIRIPDLSEAPKLEVVIMEGCTNLIEVPSSIGTARKITHLNFNDCKSLCSFPSCLQLTELEFLSLRNCAKITMVPMIPQSIKELVLSGTAIEQVPTSIGHQPQLLKLKLASCKSLKSLPTSIGMLALLQSLDLSECSQLATLPESICDLTDLQYLLLRGCQSLKRLPENVGDMESLKRIDASFSGIEELPSSVNSLRKLEDLNYSGSGQMTLHSLENLSSVRELSLVGAGLKEIPDSIGLLSSLRELYLSRNDFESLPATIKRLSNLSTIDLSDCKKLQCLPELPSGIELVDVPNCTSLESLPQFFSQGQREYEDFMKLLNFGNCTSLDPHSCNKVMREAFKEIQFITTSISCQESAGKDESFWEPDLLGFRLCIPGTELPGWFKYNSAGSSLSLKLKPSRSNSKVRGCIFCAVVGFKGDSTRVWDIKCGCHLIRGPDDMVNFESQYRLNHFFQEEADIVLEQEHVFFWYESSFVKSKKGFREATFEFYAIDKDNNRVQDCLITKSGVLPLFADNSLERGKNVQEEYNNEKERKRKRKR